MDGTITLEVVAEDKQVLSEEVDSVTAPGAEGYFMVLPGHTPFLTLLKVGELYYRQGEAEKCVFLGEEGYAQVLPHRVIIMARVADRAEEIDVERARASLRRAEERLAQAEDHVDHARASRALERAKARLHAAERAQRASR